MCEQETKNALTTFRGTVTVKDCKINWETTTISRKPAIKLMFTQNKKKTNYKIEPEPNELSQNDYQRLVEAAVERANLTDPEMSFPSSILNVKVSSNTYNLHKG